MSDSITLDTFPGSTVEGLAMLWTKSHADDAATPQELCRMYWKAYYQIALINKDTAMEIKAKLMA